MIKITDDQAQNSLNAINVSIGFKEQTPYSATANGLAEFTKSLTKEQRIALIEEIGLSVVEWVEFNPNGTEEDFKAIPKEELLLINIDEGVVPDTFDGFGFVIFGDLARHWCELPQRKESKP